MFVAVESSGVMPLPVTMFGVIAPEYNNTPAPELRVPTPKCVAVPDPPVPAGKVMAATGATALFETAHPPEVLTTATRA